MSLFGLTLLDVQKFFLVFVRLSAIMVILPFFGERSAPVQLRLGLALLITVAIFPLVNNQPLPPDSSTLLGFSLALAQSLMAGLMIGFIPVMLFAGVQLGGELSGFQMGFGITSVIDPLSQIRMSLIAQLDYILAILIFVSIDGHLYLLEGVVKSFQVIPLAGAVFRPETGNAVAEISKEMFIIGLKIAAPLMVAIFLTNIGLGILGRTMPQMNIFIVGFPLQIGIGLITLGMSIPVFAYVFEKMWAVYLKKWLAIVFSL